MPTVLQQEVAMLNLEHPRTPHVFAAYHQITLIHKFAYNISIGTGRGRRDFYHIIKPAFVALNWINSHHFDNRQEIADLISSLDQELLTLAEKTHDESYVENRRNCPVCAAAITEFGSYQPPGADFTVPELRYCEPCLERFCNLLEALKSLNSGFGIEAI